MDKDIFVIVSQPEKEVTTLETYVTYLISTKVLNFLYIKFKIIFKLNCLLLYYIESIICIGLFKSV